MYDFQNTVLISARPTAKTMALRYAALILAALGLLACIWISPFVFALPAVLLIVLWWWSWFHTGLEYEYAYFNGDLDFDLIRDKRKRKNVISVNMEQVEQIAPAGDRSLQSARRDSGVKFIDVSSRKEGRNFYELLWRDGMDAVLIRFEPDGKFLDSISVKYGRKVIR